MTRFINEKLIIKGYKFWISSIDDANCCICPLYRLCMKNWILSMMILNVLVGGK